MLKGEKVILRALREADFDAWYNVMQGDVELALWGSGRWAPQSPEAAREYWQNLIHVSPDVGVSFAIEVEGDFVGMLRLKDIQRRSQNAWLSIVLGDAANLNKGYGRDAIRTALRWAFEIHNLHRVSLDTWSTNERAIRSYKAAGFIEEGRMREAVWVDGAYLDVVQMGVLRTEWLAANQLQAKS